MTLSLFSASVESHSHCLSRSQLFHAALLRLLHEDTIDTYAFDRSRLWTIFVVLDGKPPASFDSSSSLQTVLVFMYLF